MIVTKKKEVKDNRIRNETFLHVDLLIWRRSVHCTKAEPNPEWFGPGLSCSHHLHHLFLNPLPFEGETLNGVVRATHRERERQKPGPYCWSQSLCHGWPHTPRWPVSALEQSRTLGPAHTSCHCCLLHRPGTDTAHCTAWTTHSNSATFNWPTIGTSAWPIDRSPTTSHSTGRLCITPIVVFIVVPLLW